MDSACPLHPDPTKSRRDFLRTGADGRVVVVMGKDALLIRANSEVDILGISW